MNEEQNNQIINPEINTELESYPEKKSKLKIILIVVGILILLGLIIYFVFFSSVFFGEKPTADENQINETLQVKQVPYKSLWVEDGDMDNDGLSDVEEEKLGTSDKEFDTDFDGIPDKVEVEQYKTDPTKFDTDGDGYGDGYEIINGYNPLGEGKL